MTVKLNKFTLMQPGKGEVVRHNIRAAWKEMSDDGKMAQSCMQCERCLQRRKKEKQTLAGVQI